MSDVKIIVEAIEKSSKDICKRLEEIDLSLYSLIHDELLRIYDRCGGHD